MGAAHRECRHERVVPGCGSLPTFARSAKLGAMNGSQEHLRVLVAEDNVDLSAAVCALVDAEPGMQVVGTVERSNVLLQAVRDSAPQVVVLDLNLEGESSVASMHAVRLEFPRVAVVIYSGYDPRDIASALPALGAFEYVAKSGDPAELIDAIRRAGHAAASGGS